MNNLIKVAVQIFFRPIGRREVYQRPCCSLSGFIVGNQTIRQQHCQLVHRHGLKRSIHIRKSGMDSLLQTRIAQNSVTQKRKCACLLPQRVTHQRRFNIQHAIVKPGCCSSLARMHFVGVKDDHLSCDTVGTRTAIVEALDAPDCVSDRVGIMAMWRICLSREIRLNPLDAGLPRRGQHPIVRARSFKTRCQVV